MARTRTTRPRRPVAPGGGVPVETEEGQTSVDPTDVIAGVVLLVAIPLLTYVVLSLIGFPVSGAKGKSFQEQLAEREKFQKRVPPITEPEIRDKLELLYQLIDEQARTWVDRARKEEDAVEIQRFLQYGLSTLGHAEGQLQVILGDIRRFKEPTLASYEQQIERRIIDITEKKYDIIKQTPFVDIRKRLEESYGVKKEDTSSSKE